MWKTPNHPPPNYAVDSYKQQVETLKFSGTTRDRRTSENESTLPAWIFTMRCSEKNADNPGPAKRNKVMFSPIAYRAVEYTQEAVTTLQEEVEVLRVKLADCEESKKKAEKECDASKEEYESLRGALFF